MKAWRVVFLYFLVLDALVQHVTSLEEELADSIFGEFPLQTSHTFAVTHNSVQNCSDSADTAGLIVEVKMCRVE